MSVKERETKVEVKTYLVYIDCEVCGESLKPTGTMLASNPPQYPHRCINKHEENLPYRYPKQILVPTKL